MTSSCFNGRVIIITGASSGIGFGIAVHFAKLGAKLVLTGRNEQRLNSAKEECVKAGAKAEDVVCVAGEITDDDLRKKLVQTAVEKFGGIHVLVNNAGTAAHVLVCGEKSTIDTFDNIFNVNVRSVIELCRLASPHLIKTKGNIVNISSVASMQALAHGNYYCMSKAALDTFAKCLAQELAPHGVRVNNVNPAGVDTPMLRDVFKAMGLEPSTEQINALMSASHPIGRGGNPEDIAGAIAYLASDQASWITGTIMKVDGGYLIKGESVLQKQ